MFYFCPYLLDSLSLSTESASFSTLFGFLLRFRTCIFLVSFLLPFSITICRSVQRILSILLSPHSLSTRILCILHPHIGWLILHDSTVLFSLLPTELSCFLNTFKDMFNYVNVPSNIGAEFFYFSSHPRYLNFCTNIFFNLQYVTRLFVSVSFADNHIVFFQLMFIPFISPSFINFLWEFLRTEKSMPAISFYGNHIR